MSRIILASLVVAAVVLPVRAAGAFDYLEHSYFTDRACLDAQRALAERLDGQTPGPLAARYLALGLVCPQRWKADYCAEGYKAVSGTINLLEGPPAEVGEVSVTLGDYAALADHLSRQGPVEALDRLGRYGLVGDTWLWLGAEADGAGGVVGDVAEDACEPVEAVPWARVEADIASVSQPFAAGQQLPRLSHSLLSPLVRAPVRRGPHDPAGAYSFDNPHYLDLVLRNHHHFGQHAYAAWLGFHAAAVETAGRSCQQVIGFDADQLDDIADEHGGRWDDVDWDDLGATERASRGCRMLADIVRGRLLVWAERADPALVRPVQPILDAIAAADSELAFVLLEDVAVALTALVLEGTGLHYLQDGLAAGHLRTIRSKEQLDEVRYDHDFDNEHGLAATFQTRTGFYPFVAFGDGYLLGPPTAEPETCDWQTPPSPAVLTACLIRLQRGLLAMTTSASLIDWSLGGTLYDEPLEPVRQTEKSCVQDDRLEQLVCRSLPVRMTAVGGYEDASGQVVARMPQGAIPIPPPPYAYESLSTSVGFELTGDGTEFGLHLNLLSELDDRANWMTSHQMGLRATLADGAAERLVPTYAYGFHWRWAARFLLEARAEAFAGFQGVKSGDTAFVGGVAPLVGTTVLPEGWTKLPLELTVSYRLPLQFFSTEAGLFADVFGGHWLTVGLGLAFM